VFRTRSTGTTSTKATSTTRCQCRSALSARNCRWASTSSNPPACQSHPSSVPHPRHVTSSYGTPYPARSSTAATTRQPLTTESTSSTTAWTSAAGADHFLLGGVVSFLTLPAAGHWSEIIIRLLCIHLLYHPILRGRSEGTA